MKKSISVILITLSAVVLLACPLWAADEQPELKIQELQLHAYAELVEAQPLYRYGIDTTLKFDDKILLSVTALVAPQWTDQIDRARVEYKTITLVPDGGQEIPMIGYFERHAEFKMSTDSFYASRPSDWKEKPKTFDYNAVFAVPRGTKSAEFKLGDASAKFDVPADLEDPPLASEVVQVEVLEASFPEPLISIVRVGDLEPKPQTMVSVPYGQLLRLHLKITPTNGNGGNPDHFFWYTPWFGIVTDSGAYVPTMGEIFMDKMNDGVSHNLSRSSGQAFSGGEVKLYFAAPQGTTSYTLLFLGAPVAKGELNPPAAKPKAAGEEGKGKSLIKGIMNQQ